MFCGEINISSLYLLINFRKPIFATMMIDPHFRQIYHVGNVTPYRLTIAFPELCKLLYMPGDNVTVLDGEYRDHLHVQFHHYEDEVLAVCRVRDHPSVPSILTMIPWCYIQPTMFYLVGWPIDRVFALSGYAPVPYGLLSNPKVICDAYDVLRRRLMDDEGEIIPEGRCLCVRCYAHCFGEILAYARTRGQLAPNFPDLRTVPIVRRVYDADVTADNWMTSSDVVFPGDD